jgi:hypothetical protein
MMNLFTRKIAISPAQKASVHEQGQAFKDHVTKIVHNAREAVQSNKWEPAMAGVPDDFAKISDDAEDIAKTHSVAKARANEGLSKNDDFYAKAERVATNEMGNKGYAFTEDWERYLVSKYGANQVVNVTKSRISSSERSKIDSWNWISSDKLYLKYKHVYNNDLYFNQVTGAPIYPNNDGFANAWPDIAHMEKGQLIDRFGSNGNGKYFSPIETTFENRALPPFMENQPYTKYKVNRPFKTYSGEISPWFAQPGKGIQFYTKFKIKDRNGNLVEANVNNLLKWGYIVPVK